MIMDYIGIRDNMREAMKIYGGNTSAAPTRDDVEQATQAFREELEILKQLFTNYDLTPFLRICFCVLGGTEHRKQERQSEGIFQNVFPQNRQADACCL